MTAMATLSTGRVFRHANEVQQKTVIKNAPLNLGNQADISSATLRLSITTLKLE